MAYSVLASASEAKGSKGFLWPISVFGNVKSSRPYTKTVEEFGNYLINVGDKNEVINVFKHAYLGVMFEDSKDAVNFLKDLLNVNDGRKLVSAAKEMVTDDYIVIQLIDAEAPLPENLIKLSENYSSGIKYRFIDPTYARSDYRHISEFVEYNVDVAEEITQEADDYHTDKYLVLDTVRTLVDVFTYPGFKAGKGFNVALVGNAGNGKTESAKYIHHFTQKKYGKEIKFISVSVQNITSVTDLFMRQELINDGGVTVTRYEPSEFFHAVTEGDCIILINELNRTAPDIINGLLDILDNSGQFSVFGKTYKVGKNIGVIATFNLGYQYTGTFDLDGAIKNRFHSYTFLTLPDAATLAEIGQKVYPNLPITDIAFAAKLVSKTNEAVLNSEFSYEASIRSMLIVLGAIDNVVTAYGIKNYKSRVVDVYTNSYVNRVGEDVNLRGKLIALFNITSSELGYGLKLK